MKANLCRSNQSLTLSSIKPFNHILIRTDYRTETIRYLIGDDDLQRFSRLVRSLPEKVNNLTPEKLERLYRTIEKKYHFLLHRSLYLNDSIPKLFQFFQLAVVEEQINTPGDGTFKRSISQFHTDIEDLAAAFKRFRFAFLMKKSMALLRNESIEEGLRLFSVMLSTSPAHRDLHVELDRLIEKSNRYGPRCRGLKKRFCFKHTDSFGASILRKPVFISCRDPFPYVYITDAEPGSVHQFSLDGKLKQTLPVRIDMPGGMFIDERGVLWVCDRAKGQLLALEADGTVKTCIRIKDVIGKDAPLSHPVYCCILRDRIFLLLTDSAMQRRKVITFSQTNPRLSLSTIPTGAIDMPSYMAVDRENLLISDYHKGRVFKLESDLQTLRPLNWSGFVPPFRGFCKQNNAIYACAGDKIIKLDKNGRHIFTSALYFLPDPETAVPSSIGICRPPSGAIMLVLDRGNNCIHRMDIESAERAVYPTDRQGKIDAA